MRSDVPEKQLAIVDEIDAQGSADSTRLTVSTPWFGHARRLSAFGLWIAKRSAGRKGWTKAAAGALMDEARALLGTTATREGLLRAMEPNGAKLLHDRARDFQNESQHQQRGSVRIIHCRPLHLVGQGLELHLSPAALPTEGSTLAAEFCRHPESRYGDSLNGPSRATNMETVRFMSNHEAVEEADGRYGPVVPPSDIGFGAKLGLSAGKASDNVGRRRRGATPSSRRLLGAGARVGSQLATT